MARIRTIKPEFPQSESVGKLSRDARLLYIQLWTIVDDAGRARAASRMLASLLYPYDDDARDLIEGWLTELEHGEHIRRYEVDGSQYLEITKWLEHQKIDKPSRSRLPEFVEGSRVVAKPREPSATDLGPSTLDLGPEKASLSRAASPSSEEFETLKRVYPRRKGNYGWKAAERKFNSLVKTGVDPKAIIASARRLGETLSARVGTEYIPMPASWLNSEDFLDLAVTAFEPNCDDGLIEVVNQDQLDAWDAYGRQVNGRTYPRNKKGGWRFPSKWPPGYEANLVAGVEKILTGRGVQ
jgi:hypothetical protein